MIIVGGRFEVRPEQGGAFLAERHERMRTSRARMGASSTRSQPIHSSRTGSVDARPSPVPRALQPRAAAAVERRPSAGGGRSRSRAASSDVSDSPAHIESSLFGKRLSCGAPPVPSGREGELGCLPVVGWWRIRELLVRSAGVRGVSRPRRFQWCGGCRSPMPSRVRRVQSPVRGMIHPFARRKPITNRVTGNPNTVPIPRKSRASRRVTRSQRVPTRTHHQGRRGRIDTRRDTASRLIRAERRKSPDRHRAQPPPVRIGALSPIVPRLVVPQDRQGDRTVERCNHQGLQVRVRIRESVGIAFLVDDLGIDVPLSVPKRDAG